MGKEEKCLVSDTGCTKAQYTIFKKHFELEISYSNIKMQNWECEIYDVYVRIERNLYCKAKQCDKTRPKC